MTGTATNNPPRNGNPTRMPAPQPRPKATLTGLVEARRALRDLTGWIGCHACADIGPQAEITVSTQGRVIGRGTANSGLRNLPNLGSIARGFRITCDEPVTDAALAFGDVIVEARDAAGHSATLPLFELV